MPKFIVVSYDAQHPGWKDPVKRFGRLADQIDELVESLP